MRSIATFGIGAAAPLASLATAGIAAAQSYPRLSGSGEDAVLEYGPGAPNNLVGGGRVALGHDGDSIAVQRSDAGIAQQPSRGQVATLRNENGTLELVQVPIAPTAPALAGSDLRAPRG